MSSLILTSFFSHLPAINLNNIIMNMLIVNLATHNTVIVHSAPTKIWYRIPFPRPHSIKPIYHRINFLLILFIIFIRFFSFVFLSFFFCSLSVCILFLYFFLSYFCIHFHFLFVLFCSLPSLLPRFKCLSKYSKRVKEDGKSCTHSILHSLSLCSIMYTLISRYSNQIMNIIFGNC